jgi:hypothetical protein
MRNAEKKGKRNKCSAKYAIESHQPAPI